jgi:integrator complex subunit 2
VELCFAQAFIAEPEMVKLVHFQGYPATLLPVMVTHVPSMHICLKFIPELVTQPQTDKQQFGVLLASFVVQQYPLPEALSIVDEILKCLLALANEIPSHLREDYFAPLLPALVRFCRTFPPLCQKVTQLLVGLSRGSSNVGLSSTPSFVLNAAASSGREKGRGTGGAEFVTLVRDTFQELVETAVLRV